MDESFGSGGRIGWVRWTNRLGPMDESAGGGTDSTMCVRRRLGASGVGWVRRALAEDGLVEHRLKLGCTGVRGSTTVDNCAE